MRENLGEPLTLDDLAGVAMFSKFHFSRMFLQTTGVSPGRFLSALRLQRAKELLLTTDWNVVDIGIRVGYTSVGTFSTRFSRGVGLSPTEYRRRRGFVPYAPSGLVGRPTGLHSIQGRLSQPCAEPARTIFIGLFPGRVPEGQPISSTVVHGSSMFALRTAHEGDCYLIAFSTSTSADHALADERTRWLGCRRLHSLKWGVDVTGADVRVLPPDELDLPVVTAMPNVHRLFPVPVDVCHDLTVSA